MLVEPEASTSVASQRSPRPERAVFAPLKVEVEVAGHQRSGSGIADAALAPGRLLDAGRARRGGHLAQLALRSRTDGSTNAHRANMPP